MYKLNHVLTSLIILVSLNGCLIKKDGVVVADNATATAAGGSGSGSGAGGGTVVATPTPQGMYCTNYNGWDYLPTYPVFSNTTVTGSTVNSVAMQVHYEANGGGAMTGATTYSTTMQLRAYTCGSSSSLGSLQGTATATLGLNGSDRNVVFTFSTPIAIPSSGACGANPYPLVFEFVGGAGNVSGYQLAAQSTLTSSACATPQSASSTAASPRVRAWTVIISGSP